MKNLLSYLCLTIAVVGSIYLVYYSFSNPDMTRTRIFLNRWYIDLGVFIFAFLSGVLNEDGQLWRS